MRLIPVMSSHCHANVHYCHQRNIFDVAEEAKRKMQEPKLSESESKISSSPWAKDQTHYRWFKRNSTPMSGEDPPPTSASGESEKVVEHDPLPIDHVSILVRNHLSISRLLAHHHLT